MEEYCHDVLAQELYTKVVKGAASGRPLLYNYTGHHYIGHNYIGHKYTGHSDMGRNYIGLCAFQFTAGEVEAAAGSALSEARTM